MEILVAAVTALMMFVNGATDTPGCIAGAVTSGAISYGRASMICAAGNFFGTVMSCLLFPQVARNIVSLADISTAGVLASLMAAVIFSSVAWFFGIPTSESHGLIAALGGASLFLRGGIAHGFVRLVKFSFISCAAGAFAGYGVMLFVKRREMSAHDSFSLLALSAAGSSFCHGAQDGQKFAAILAFAVADSRITVGVSLLSAMVLAIGCFFGGKKMIDLLGKELTGTFYTAEAVSSDIASFTCCVLSSVIGVPVSTTYMKTFAMVGAAKAVKKRVDLKTIGDVLLAWVLTYPVCMILSYLLCALLSRF